MLCFAVYRFFEILVTEYIVHRSSTKKSVLSVYEVLESNNVCLNVTT